jgi:hypothetical protein
VGTSDSWKLLVFRDGRRLLSGPDLRHGLVRQIEAVLSLSDFSSHIARDELVDVLLRAGELECALADENDKPREAATLAEITDHLARALVERTKPRFSAGGLDRLKTLAIPVQLNISTPEGFCYYALHPLDYADLLSSNPRRAAATAVVGIRSIGVTLSAVVHAWFQAKGVPSERITVRPTGHPFDRALEFDDTQRRWIHSQIQLGAEFLIVDEGPGLSGSSFLAVAEALERERVPVTRISLLPSSTPNLENLIAPNAANRWNRFRTLPLRPTRYLPSEAAEYIGGGNWRRHVFISESAWPGVWSWTERQKFLSHDGRQIYRFDGHGRYGKEVRRRSELLHDHHWGPAALSVGDGFTASSWLHGVRPSQADRDIILQLAAYCAFRARYFSCAAIPSMELKQMAEVNLQRALGVNRQVTLAVERPVIADARMMPCEWMLSAEGRLLKLDAASHGDDHFYPGPTDIAWDLAGAIVEWNLDQPAAETLVQAYEQTSGDPISVRLGNYLIAYSAFRMAFTASAAISVSCEKERARFAREEMGYRKSLLQHLQLTSKTTTP